MPRKQDTYTRAKKVLAGGVSASMRVHPYLERPVYVTRGEGAYVWDEDGNQLIDFNNSNGATMLGHGYPEVQEAIQQAVSNGYVTAGETEEHVKLAERLCKMIPSAERARFASTGTEATSVALRLARHVTGRDKFVKFNGHFHGLSDAFLFQQRDMMHASAKPQPVSGGVPASYAYDSLSVSWNDREALDELMEREGTNVAAIICEPVWYNAGCVPPDEGFLEHLREKADEYGAVLVFDEVLSGFRMAPGGAQEHFEVTPDITTLAKALANGMPLSAIVGKADIMEELAPVGTVAHSGTYSGHPLAIAAANASIDVLSKKKTYNDLNKTANWFYEQLQESFDAANVPVRVQGLGARFGLYFNREEDVRSSEDAATNDHRLNAQFVNKCYERGVYFHAYRTAGPPGHSGITLSHSRDDLSHALEVMAEVAKELRP
jgi:glutamate-1-semialdehyde 2,1-aminomutase